MDPDEDEDADLGSDGGYFYPYCGVQAPGDAWWTQAQLSLAENLVATQIVGPALNNLGGSMKDMGRRSGGFLQATVEYAEPKKADPLTEDDDMRRVDFDCHDQPLKVLDDWRKPVRCFMCGEASAA